MFSELHKRFYVYKNDTIQFTVSIGVSEARQDDSSFEDVLDRADNALYKAKQSGRDCVKD